MSENGSGSDWIYLLLTLVAGFISLLKSQGAKRKKAHSSPDIFISEAESRWEEEVETPTISEIKEKNSEWFDTLASRHEKAVSGISEEPEEEESETFDLRKAVISSEILKRKYD